MKAFFILLFLAALFYVNVEAHFPVYSAYGVERKPIDVFRLLSEMRNNVQKKAILQRLSQNDYDY